MSWCGSCNRRWSSPERTGPTKKKVYGPQETLFLADVTSTKRVGPSVFCLVFAEAWEPPKSVQLPHQDIAQGIIPSYSDHRVLSRGDIIDENSSLSHLSERMEMALISFIYPLVQVMVRLMVMGGSLPLGESGWPAISGLYAQMHKLPSPSYVAAKHSPSAVSAGSSSCRIVAWSWTPERTAQEWTRQLERIRELQPGSSAYCWSNRWP